MNKVNDEENVSKTNTYKINITGLVQGVGFRPFVFQLAKTLGLNGQVNNGAEGVEIVFNATTDIATLFFQEVLNQAPSLAKIQNSSLEQTDNQYFTEFLITESTSKNTFSLLLTPDFGMCSDCRKELYEQTNRRYRYPFITCTNCGPRYSIITKLPYDRPQTTMANFTLCPTCEHEYNNPEDRRFFAQTNSCDVCGPQLSWYKTDEKHIKLLSELHDSHWILTRVKDALEAGKILAVKGIGGYLLICDATNETAIQLLRERKNRPTKPFAVLFPTLEALEKEAFVSQQEANSLTSVAAPIVLVKQKNSPHRQIATSVNPRLKHVGAMLPYTPLLDLIANDFGKPLVATSGNISGSPIIFEDDKAFTELSSMADYFLTNNRQIVLPQDDSVIRFSKKYQQKIIIRRSRGTLLALHPAPKLNGQFLSFGASLKSTFAIKNEENLYVSQYLGALESYDTQQNFEYVLTHFTTLLGNNQEQYTLFCDAHEGYFSTQLAIQLGEKWHLPVHKIQHHEAHLAAVLAENNIPLTEDSVMGVIWDGTGYGNDGNIWGGEFFINHKRIHFDYFDAILGDKMPREPRISALSLTHQANCADLVKGQLTTQEWNLYTKILTTNSLKTSSVGRLFDAVASILGLIEKQSFEGEAAMLLEELAETYFQEKGYDFEESYSTNFVGNVPTKQFILGIIQDINEQKTQSFIAAKFHYSLVQCIRIIAEQYHIKKLAFSGGVFQNTVLVDLLIHQLQDDFQLFFHKQLSPNDENIAFGQLIIGSSN
jgi:hydrogenase maturation protein HypF